ncbi:MAG TPA: T9SS type A sorting domain-containing protein [Bacteroidia bacterium]|nr:T9SS type A sorting domain-containing protein [Bacteroidia bacterium]
MKHFYLFILALVLLSNRSMAQATSGACNNIDFSAGNFTNWQGQWNNVSAASGSGVYGALTASGLNSSPTGYNDMGFVHEICNGGVDRNVPINRVAPGHSYSVRLGDDSAQIQNINSTNMYPYNHQNISTTFSVTVANQTVTYWYAVVLSQSSAAAHPVSQQPYFSIKLYDSTHQEITCARYNVNGTTAFAIGGFDTLKDATGATTFMYKDWTPVTIPLSQYFGQKITLTFETSDCAAGGHFGYAYIAADCGSTTTTQPPLTASYTLVQDAAPQTWDAYPTYSSNVINARWYWGDGSCTMGLYPSHIYNAAGKYSICVAAYSNCGDSVVYCQNDSVYRYTNNAALSNLVYINILNPQTTGIENINDKKLQANIYPNPANQNFCIETNSKQLMQLFDVSGKLVLQQTIENKTTVDVSHLQKGVYTISLTSSQGISNKKLILVGN